MLMQVAAPIRGPMYAGYAKVLATKPIMVSGADGQGILADLGKVSRQIKDFLINYTNRVTEK